MTRNREPYAVRTLTPEPWTLNLEPESVQSRRWGLGADPYNAMTQTSTRKLTVDILSRESDRLGTVRLEGVQIRELRAWHDGFRRCRQALDETNGQHNGRAAAKQVQNPGGVEWVP